MSSLPTAITMTTNQQLVVRGSLYDAYGNIPSAALTWTTSNASIATVQNTVNLLNGALISTYANVGTATITATSNDNSTTAVFNLTVISSAPGTTSDIELDAGDALQPKKPIQA